MSKVPTPTPSAPPARRRPWRLLLICLSVGLLAVSAAGAGWWQYRRSLPQPPEVDTSDREQEIGAAIGEAREKVRQQPWSGAAWGRLGMVLFAHHFEAEARVCLAEAGRLDTREPRWSYLEGRLVQQRDPEAALPPLRQAAALAGKAEAPRLYLAESLLALGHTDEAAASFRSLLEDDPRNPRAHLGMGRLVYQQGDLDRSQQHARAAAAAAPSLRAPHVLLAEIYRCRGDLPNEERELALVTPGEDPPWADPYMEQMSQMLAGSEAVVAQAKELLREGRRPEATGLLLGTVRTYPDAFQPKVMLGKLMIEQGDLVGAEPQLRAALQLQPESIDAIGLLGVLLQRRQQYRDAADCYQQMIALKPGDATAHVNLAACRDQLGDRAGAVDALRDALRFKPDFVLAHKTLGRLLADLHQDAEAAEHLQDALRLAPNDAETKQWLEQVRARLPQPGKLGDR
jgi:tetratricopeptide (TPR) repeat protein